MTFKIGSVVRLLPDCEKTAGIPMEHAGQVGVLTRNDGDKTPMWHWEPFDVGSRYWWVDETCAELVEDV